MDDEINLEHAELYASDNRGVYIPQYFAQSVMRDKVSNVSNEDWAILEHGPDHEWYWDTWYEVLDKAVLTSNNGRKWYLYQDGDLWIVPHE